jgi:phenylacetate-CoA ligase
MARQTPPGLTPVGAACHEHSRAEKEPLEEEDITMITAPEWLDEGGQIARLAERVPRWLAKVPLYRRIAPDAGCSQRGAAFLRCFRTLPIISKREIRQEFPRNFLPAGVDLDGLVEHELVELERTAGTSEEPTPLLLAHGWWQKQEQEALRLNPWVARYLSPQARRVTIASPVCTSEICYQGIPSWSDRIVGQSLFTNIARHPFLWSEAMLDRMVEETVGWGPVFLDVDPVYGVLFALHCERRGVRLPSLKFVLCSYEFLSRVHRRILRRVFGVPVFNLYGSTETGHLLMENEHGEMVPSLTTAFLELTAKDDEGIGDLIVTTLSNDYMPLIRYRIGDLARETRTPYRTVFEVHGRARDAVVNARGKRITVAQIDRCLDDLDGIVHYLLSQEQAGDFSFNYVADGGRLTEVARQDLRARLEDLLGTKDGLTLRPMDILPCESSGKFRLSRPRNETV